MIVAHSTSGVVVKEIKGDHQKFEIEGTIIKDIAYCRPIYIKLHYIIMAIIVYNVESVPN